MEILVTNDDGVLAEGITVLRRALEPLGKVWVVAPEREQSGASHALTLHRPLRVRRIEESVYSVDGTPTDCVMLACRGIPELKDATIDLVVSGINHGPNLSDDIGYSGTVAAAMEGRMLSRPSVAVSSAAFRPGAFAPAGEVARIVVERLIHNEPPPGVVLNVNVPDRPLDQMRGVRITKLGKREYVGEVHRKTDPRGRPYYWIGEGRGGYRPETGSDEEALLQGYVSITPIHLDLTEHKAFDLLEGWGFPTEGFR
ncbi:MAG: 5'/3'-nucleotidase SurE [Candidatus Eisenbacteria bacterium]|nr:5'/3'-nucleotidase SurE [Candidatus Latescibacterota bacterium]MBD3301246.1 5'/3'-nucleotidase SurE [Candidatus Eisenbacteria bacterium]